jgi:hypothetical protein
MEEGKGWGVKRRIGRMGRMGPMGLIKEAYFDCKALSVA